MKCMNKLLALILSLAVVLSLAGCGGENGGTAETGLAGEYSVVSLVMGGEEYSRADLEAVGMADGTFLQLNADNTGVVGLGGDDPENFTYDVEAGTAAFLGGESIASFSVEGDVITIDLASEGLTFVFSRDAATPGASADIDNAAVTGDPSQANGQVADTLISAFEGYVLAAGDLPSGDLGMGQDGFTDDEGSGVTLYGEWYGWISIADCWGGYTETFEDVNGKVGYNSDYGMKYIDIYAASDSESPVFSMWIEDEPTDTKVIPIIGDEDAWILDKYLTAEDASQFDISVDWDGSIYFIYWIDNGDSGCLVEIYMRPVGAEWDETNDVIPPGYDL